MFSCFTYSSTGAISCLGSSSDCEFCAKNNIIVRAAMLAPRKSRLNYNPGKADYARRLLDEDDGKGCRRKVSAVAAV